MSIASRIKKKIKGALVGVNPEDWHTNKKNKKWEEWF